MGVEIFDTVELQNFLVEVFKVYEDDSTFIGVLNENNNVEIRFRSLNKIDTARFTNKKLEINGVLIELDVNYTEGADIIPLLGHPEKDPFIQQAPGQLTFTGGDICQNIAAGGFYGTISFFVLGEISVEVRGPYGNKKCVTQKALVSNNHVIGRSDAGQAGEEILTINGFEIAKLSCTIPFKLQGNVDISTAVITDESKIQNWHVKEIGKLTTLRRPTKESIRKYGARTGLTSGTVIGTANIVVAGYKYYNVFITSGGFNCPGDSGSAVVGSDNAVLGLVTWGDNIDCSQNPKGYFFTMVNPGTLIENSSVVTIELKK